MRAIAPQRPGAGLPPRPGCYGHPATAVPGTPTNADGGLALLGPRPNGASRSEDFARRRIVARILRQMGVADRPVRGDHQHAAELGGMPLDLALVDDNAAETKPRHDRVLDPPRDHPGPKQLVKRGDLGPRQLVRPPFGVGE